MSVSKSSNLDLATFMQLVCGMTKLLSFGSKRVCSPPCGSLCVFCLSSEMPSSVAEGMDQVDGIVGLHVDDFVGGGAGMDRIWKHGRERVPYDVPCFSSRMSRMKFLTRALELVTMHLHSRLFITGIKLVQPNCRWKSYLENVKPISVGKERRANPQAETACYPSHVVWSCLSVSTSSTH